MELSTDKSAYRSSLTLTQAVGAVNQQIYIRIKTGTTNKVVEDKLTISSPGKATIYTPVIGAVQPPNLSITAVDVQKDYLAALPTFTVTYSRFLGTIEVEGYGVELDVSQLPQGLLILQMSAGGEVIRKRVRKD